MSTVSTLVIGQATSFHLVTRPEDFREHPGQTTLLPVPSTTRSHSIMVWPPGGTPSAVEIDPTKLCSRVDQDALSGRIESSMERILTELQLPPVPIYEKRAGQRFTVPMLGLTIAFHSCRYPNYLDIGIVSSRGTVDYNHKQSGNNLKHSGDRNIVPNDLIQSITGFDVSQDSVFHLLIAGFGSCTLNRFTGGGVLMFCSADVAYPVVVDFPADRFGAAGEAGPVACHAVSLQISGDQLVCDVLINGVTGTSSAPFQGEFVTRCLQSRLISLETVMPSATPVERWISSATSEKQTLPVRHRVDAWDSVVVEMTREQHDLYDRILKLYPNSKKSSLMLINEELYIPVCTDQRLKQETVVEALHMAASEMQANWTHSSGIPSNKSLKQHDSRHVLHMTVAGMPTMPTMPAAFVQEATARLFWTGVSPTHKLRDAVIHMIGAQLDPIDVINVFSGVNRCVDRQGAHVHLPLALADEYGLSGGRPLLAATECQPYRKSLRTRTLVIMGRMSPEAVVCAGPNRTHGIFVATDDDMGAFKAMASPASMLFRVCLDDSSMVCFVDGVQAILDRVLESGDKVPLSELLDWTLHGVQLPVSVCSTIVNSDGVPSCPDGADDVYILGGHVADAAELARAFIDAEVWPAGPYDLRTGALHRLDADLRARGLHDHAGRLQQVAAGIGVVTYIEDSCGYEAHPELWAQVQDVLSEMMAALLNHNAKRRAWLEIKYQMAWFGGTARKMALRHYANPGMEAVKDGVAWDLAEVLRRRRSSSSVIEKMRVLQFNSSDVRTSAQLEQQIAKSVKSVGRLTKESQIKGNLDTIANWTADTMADHIDEVCKKEDLCAVFMFPALEAVGLRDGVIPTLQMQSTPLGAEVVAALLQSPNAKPPGLDQLMPVFHRAVVPSSSGNIVYLCIPVTDQSSLNQLPDNLQVMSASSGGYGCLRPAMLQALGTRPLQERRDQLEQLIVASVRQAVQHTGEHARKIIRGLTVMLLCMWASGSVPFSFAFQLAQSQGLEKLPKSDDVRDWDRIELLRQVWPSTGWEMSRMNTNLADVAFRCFQRAVSLPISTLQQALSKPKDGGYFLGSDTHARKCHGCGKESMMSRSQARKKGLLLRRCIECLLERMGTTDISMTGNPGYAGYNPTDQLCVVDTTEIHVSEARHGMHRLINDATFPKVIGTLLRACPGGTEGALNGRVVNDILANLNPSYAERRAIAALIFSPTLDAVQPEQQTQTRQASISDH